MPLPAAVQDKLLEYINDMIQTIPNHMIFHNNLPARKLLDVKSAEDYALGIMIGGIFQGFLSYYLGQRAGLPVSSDELKQIAITVMSKSDEIKAGVRRAGFTI